MNYYIHFGKLYAVDHAQPGPCLCHLKAPFYSLTKEIVSPDGKPILKSEIVQENKSGKTDSRRYLLKDDRDEIIAKGSLQFADLADPWPISHAPRIDRVSISLLGQNYLLKMLNSQNFILSDQKSDNKKMEIIHDGINGGWNISAASDFAAYIVMGIFLFCRYLDKENEFVVV